MEEVFFYEVPTEEENWPSKSAPWKPRGVVTFSSESNMAAGVHQDHGLTGPMQNMVDQTDVEMAKEDHGRMMSTEYQVKQSNVLYRVIYRTIFHVIYQTRTSVFNTFQNADVCLMRFDVFRIPDICQIYLVTLVSFRAFN